MRRLCREDMRVPLALSLLIAACGSSVSVDESVSPTGAPPASTASSSPSAATTCQPTTSRDSSGVITANGAIGVLGEASTPSDTAANDYLVIVRRGAQEHEQIALQFDDIGHTSPATWVSYRVVATTRTNPWGHLVFEAGWKPIGFAGSCWRVIADGQDTGLVLFVRP